MNFIPLGKRLLIKRVEESNTTSSGIIIPDNAKEKPSKGVVSAVSSEVDTVKVGDTVVFAKYSGSELSIDGVTFLVMELDDIFGIMK